MRIETSPNSRRIKPGGSALEFEWNFSPKETTANSCQNPPAGAEGHPERQSAPEPSRELPG
jgi:hypothetical protein